MKFSVSYRYHSEVLKMVPGDVLIGSVPVVSYGDSAIVWPYIIRSVGKRVIKSLSKKYLYMISSSVSRY